MSSKKHYFIPNHLNKEPFLSVWWMEDGNTMFYVQISEDENKPTWMSYGDAVEMLSRHISDFEKDILLDLLSALKFHEAVSAEVIRNCFKEKR